MTILSDVSLPPARSAPLSRRFYLTAWRWHFYAGLYVAPFLVMLAVTGLIMLWTAAIYGRDGEKTYVVAPQATIAPVSAQAEAAFGEVAGQIVQIAAILAPASSAPMPIF